MVQCIVEQRIMGVGGGGVDLWSPCATHTDLQEWGTTVQTERFFMIVIDSKVL